MASKVSALSAIAAGTLDTAADFIYVVDTSAGTAGSLKMTPDAFLTARTFPISMQLLDAGTLILGTGSDVTVQWDGTNMIVTAAADDSLIEIGDASGAQKSFDLKWYGNANAGADFVYFDASANLIYTTGVDVRFTDSDFLIFGTGSDVTIAWDGTDLDILAAADDSVIKFGNGTENFDVHLMGQTNDIVFDASADQLIVQDSTTVAFGTGSDITVAWDGTDLDILQAAVNSSIKWGIDGAGIDQVWYGDTASTNMTWDQSADSLIMTGAARIVWTGTTGQPEMHLTDNLADALSIEISGSTDLMVFTTTDNAESVAVHGLRTKQTTGVAISGATALTLADSGGIFTVDQGSAYDVDLPSPTSGPGCTYFFSLTAPAANDVTITVLGGAATFVGSVITEGQIVVATGNTLTFASGVAVLGDSVEIRSIATNLYHVRAVSAILNGITIA